MVIFSYILLGIYYGFIFLGFSLVVGLSYYIYKLLSHIQIRNKAF